MERKKKKEVTLASLDARADSVDKALISLGRKVDGVLEMLGSFMKATGKSFDDIEKKFSVVDKKFLVLNNRVDHIDERLGFLSGKVEKIEVTMLDIQEEVRGALDAIDKDSELVLNHERRIRRLEKVR